MDDIREIIRQHQDILAERYGIKIVGLFGSYTWGDQLRHSDLDLLADILHPITPCRTIDTPCGMISVIPAELAVVERTLLAFYPRPDPEARSVAKKMLAVCVSGATPVDWDEIRRLACLPSFNVAQELEALRREVARELDLKA